MTAIQERQALDQDKLMEFVFTAVAEVGTSLNSVLMGDQLGWY